MEAIIHRLRNYGTNNPQETGPGPLNQPALALLNADARASLRCMTDAKNPGHRWHDMGGTDAGEITQGQHDFALWEKRVDALLRLSTAKGYFTVDGLRRVLEDMGADAFETMTYYERWIASITQNMVEAGAFTIEELNTRMGEVEARGPTYGEAQGSGE